MTINIKDFGLEQQSKILKRYNKYYNSDKLQWEIPSHIMKNLISECWDLSKVLTKHQKEELPSEKLRFIKEDLRKRIIALKDAPDTIDLDKDKLIELFEILQEEYT